MADITTWYGFAHGQTRIVMTTPLDYRAQATPVQQKHTHEDCQMTYALFPVTTDREVMLGTEIVSAMSSSQWQDIHWQYLLLLLSVLNMSKAQAWEVQQDSYEKPKYRYVSNLGHHMPQTCAQDRQDA
jgi:hypothetical protein